MLLACILHYSCRRRRFGAAQSSTTLRFQGMWQSPDSLVCLPASPSQNALWRPRTVTLTILTVYGESWTGC